MNELRGKSPEIPIDEDIDDFTMDELKRTELEAIAAMSQSSVQSDSLRAREEIKRIKDIMESMDSMKVISDLTFTTTTATIEGT